MFPTTDQKPNVYLTWHHNPTPKKNSSQIVWKGMKLVAPNIRGFQGLMGYLTNLTGKNPRASMAATQRALENVRPMVIPDSKYTAYLKAAKRQVPKWRHEPLGSKKTPLEIKAVFHLGPRQRPDLCNLIVSVEDVLQSLGIIGNDYFCMRPHPDSHRRRCDPADPADVPRTEVWLWERVDCGGLKL